MTERMVWMKVTCDEYELPLVCADSAKELAELCGTTAGSITSAVSHWKAGRNKYCSYRNVVIEDD